MTGDVYMNYSKIIDDFSYESDKLIKSRIVNREQIDIREEKDIINEIVLWKLNRTIHLEDETILYLNKVISSINNPLEVINSESVKKLIIMLLKSKGIRIPMASTILHFYKPDVFPIIDQRAYRELMGHELGNSLVPEKSTDLYLDYIEKCELYRKEKCPEIEFQFIDKILYQLDKQKGLKVKY